jgi:tetratricopeptide (TPR) repeat protein
MLGLGYQVSEEYDLAIAEGARAVALNECFAIAHFGLGGSYYHAGRCKEAAQSFQNAILLNPRDPRNFAVLTNLSRCLLETEQFDEAIDAARQAIPLRPNHLHAHLALVSALALAGRLAEARTAFEKCHRLDPELFERTREQIIYQGACNPETFVTNRFFEGLRKAGLPR